MELSANRGGHIELGGSICNYTESIEVRIQLFDTTLRDGTQAEGVSLSCDDKLHIAARLDEFGIDYIEGGWPGSNPKDMEFFDRARRELNLKHARLTAFGSTCKRDTDPADDPQIQLLLEANTSVISLFGKSWDLHVRDVLQTTPAENLRMIRESVAYLARHDREVIYDAEHFFDGYKDNADYALATLREAIAGGAASIVLCDTNGGALVWEVGEIVGAVRRALAAEVASFNDSKNGGPASGRLRSGSVRLGIHAHNDGDTGVANSLEAIRNGCSHVQGTINGYGERCGNANLVSIIANMQLKMGYDLVSPQALAHLTDLSHYVNELANLRPNTHQPFVGQSAFAHKGGTHVNAVLKNVDSYQHVDPEEIGNQTRVLVSELSGKDNIAVKVDEFGVEGLSREKERAVLQQIKEMENIGFEFESAEASVDLMLRRSDEAYRPSFSLIDYSVSVANRAGRGLSSEATIKVEVGEQVYHEVAEGNGPVNALMLALRKAIQSYFPHLDRLHLLDYKVRILNSDQGTGASVRVLITSSDGVRNWTTVGASTNIIEASWTAISDAVEYFLVTYDPHEETSSSTSGAEIDKMKPMADEAPPVGKPVHAEDGRRAQLTSAT